MIPRLCVFRVCMQKKSCSDGLGFGFLKAEIRILSTGSLAAQGLRTEDPSPVPGVLVEARCAQEGNSESGCRSA